MMSEGVFHQSGEVVRASGLDMPWDRRRPRRRRCRRRDHSDWWMCEELPTRWWSHFGMKVAAWPLHPGDFLDGMLGQRVVVGRRPARRHNGC